MAERNTTVAPSLTAVAHIAIATGSTSVHNDIGVPNFYGAHGHDSELDSMSAIFMAAGPDLKQRRRLRDVRAVDVAPTALAILGIEPAPTVDGAVIARALDRGHRGDREE